MKDKNQYLLDSSIWIDIARGRSSIIEKASPLILMNKVCLCDLIIAELLRGARSDADYEGLKTRLTSFPIYAAEWDQVARLGYDVARRGYAPPLSDLYIAQCAIYNGKVLVTRDEHFKQIRSVKRFRMEFWD